MGTEGHSKVWEVAAEGCSSQGHETGPLHECQPAGRRSGEGQGGEERAKARGKLEILLTSLQKRVV